MATLRIRSTIRQVERSKVLLQLALAFLGSGGEAFAINVVSRILNCTSLRPLVLVLVAVRCTCLLVSMLHSPSIVVSLLCCTSSPVDLRTRTSIWTQPVPTPSTVSGSRQVSNADFFCFEMLM